MDLLHMMFLLILSSDGEKQLSGKSLRSFSKISSQWHGDALIRIERIWKDKLDYYTTLGDDPLVWVSSEADPENSMFRLDNAILVLSDVTCLLFFLDFGDNSFHYIVFQPLQIFHSVDSGSLKGFPKCFNVALSQVH